MKKKTATILSLALVSAMAFPTFAAAAETANLIAEPPAKLIRQAPAEHSGRYIIQINGKDAGLDARRVDTCLMVPLQAIAKELGFKVTEDNGSILVDDGKMHTEVTIGKDSYFVATSIEGMIGMSAPFSLGTAPFVADGVTYVPLALFDALLGNVDGVITVDGNKVIIQTAGQDNAQADAGIGGGIGIPNPFVDCDTMADAGKIAGFTVTVPQKMPAGYAQKLIQAVEKDMVQVFYEKGEKEILIRKAKGSEDISGDYNEYKENNTITLGSLKVSARGNDGKVNTATWIDGEYTYAITANPGETGLDEVTIKDMIGAIR